MCLPSDLMLHRRRDIWDEQLDHDHNDHNNRHKDDHEEQPGEPNVPELDVGGVGFDVRLTPRPRHEVVVATSFIQIAGTNV